MPTPYYVHPKLGTCVIIKRIDSGKVWVMAHFLRGTHTVYERDLKLKQERTYNCIREATNAEVR